MQLKEIESCIRYWERELRSHWRTYRRWQHFQMGHVHRSERNYIRHKQQAKNAAKWLREQGAFYVKIWTTKCPCK